VLKYWVLKHWVLKHWVLKYGAIVMLSFEGPAAVVAVRNMAGGSELFVLESGESGDSGEQ
jgi:hypothetical protein